MKGLFKRSRWRLTGIAGVCRHWREAAKAAPGPVSPAGARQARTAAVEKGPTLQGVFDSADRRCFRWVSLALTTGGAGALLLHAFIAAPVLLAVGATFGYLGGDWPRPHNGF